jgi:hypothetical protein
MTIEVEKLSTEGLIMIYVFCPSYLNQPEYELGQAVRRELELRGALTIVGKTQDAWDLDADTREELAEVFIVHHMLETFRDLTSPVKEEDEEQVS